MEQSYQDEVLDMSRKLMKCIPLEMLEDISSTNGKELDLKENFNDEKNNFNNVIETDEVKIKLTNDRINLKSEYDCKIIVKSEICDYDEKKYDSGNSNEGRDVNTNDLVVLDDLDENYLDYEDDSNDKNCSTDNQNIEELETVSRHKYDNDFKDGGDKQVLEETDDEEMEGGYETRSEVASSSLESDDDDDNNNNNEVEASNEIVIAKSDDKLNKKKYFLKLNYLFRNARFFLMKSNNIENIDLSKMKNVWSTLPTNQKKLQTALDTCQNVILIFSAKGTRKFSGFARIRSGPHINRGSVKWRLPYDFRSDLFTDEFDLDWICRKDLPFTMVSYLRNPWNLHKQVKVGRDGQEIAPIVAEQLCRKFPIDRTVDLTTILRRSRDIKKTIRMSISSRRLNGDSHRYHHNERYDVRKRGRINRSSFRDSFHTRPRPYPSIPSPPHHHGTVYINAYPSYTIPAGPPRYYEPLSMLPSYDIDSKSYSNYVTYNIGGSSSSRIHKPYEPKRHYSHKSHYSSSYYTQYRRHR